MVGELRKRFDVGNVLRKGLVELLNDFNDQLSLRNSDADLKIPVADAVDIVADVRMAFSEGKEAAATLRIDASGLHQQQERLHSDLLKVDNVDISGNHA